MSITDEEKLKIEEEEKIREKARIRVQAKTSLKWTLILIVVGIVGTFAIFKFMMHSTGGFMGGY